MAHDVFISYSSRDKPTADAVCATLEARCIRCWIAPRDILPGAEYAAALVDAIGASRIFVLVLSAHANASPQVRREVERAVSKGLPILPFRIEDVALSKSMEYFVGSQHWLDALTPPLERHLQNLGEAVGSLLAGVAEGDPSTSAPEQPALTAPEQPDFVGQRLGPYLLGAPIGAGGSGWVYRARDERLGRDACVKVFYPFQDAFPGVATTVARAARAVAGLSHPNIVRIFDLGRCARGRQTYFYLAMEYVAGVPLERWSGPPGNPERLRDFLRVGLALADALRTAHAVRSVDELGVERVGVLHGDLKPANVLVRPDGTPVLLDFMLVDVQRLLRRESVPRDSERDAAPITAAFGTPGFMAPEQAEQGIVTVRADVYGLGMTLASLLDPAVAQAGAPWQAVRRGQLPPSLTELLAAMLHPDPERRPRDMAEVAERLAQSAAELGVAPMTPLPSAPNASDDGVPVPTDVAASGALLHGRYLVLERRPELRTAAIELAEDQLLLRRVRLESAPLPAAEAGRRQLPAEVRPLLDLAEPGLPPYLDAFAENGRAYLVTEWTAGTDLADLLRVAEPGLALEPARALVDQLLALLERCHGLDPPLVHGGLSPASIRLRAADSRPIILGLGAACLERAAHGPAGPALASGYAAPEQYNHCLATASDVYAVGALLYHLLTGHAPPDGAEIAQLRAILPPPRALVRDLPEAVEQVVLRALRPLPHERYWTAGELRRALRAARIEAAGEPKRTSLDGPPTVPAPSPSIAAAPAPVGPPAPRSGLLLGRYRLLERVGQSDLSEVWRAEQPALERQVAVKLLAGHHAADPSFRARFRQEALILARLEHPSILPVFDYGEQDGFCYLVSPFHSGRPLSRLVGRPWALGEALAVLAPLAAALDFLHTRDIVHGDVKPGNVLLSDDGRVILSDFGLARRLGVTAATTGLIVGTPQFMAPEVVRGEPPGPPSDLYGLGITAYQLLVGQLPFDGPDVFATMKAQAEQAPPRPSAVNPDLSPALDVVLLRALGKVPADRYPSGAALIEALTWAAGLPTIRPTVAAPPALFAGSITSPPRDPPSLAGSAPSDEPPTLVPAAPTFIDEPETPTALPCSALPPPATPGVADRVHFTITSPPLVQPGAAFLLDVWAHLDQQRAEMLERAREAAGGRALQHRSKGPLEVAPGTLLAVRLTIDGVDLDEHEDVLLWSGEIANATFRARVPPGASDGSRQGLATIHQNGLQVARLYFDLEVRAAAATDVPAPVPLREEQHRTAFVSYASPDREQVLLCVRGMQKEVPGLEVFLDVLRLRSGQYWERELWRVIPENDVFYLFWSANARRSEWVEREWRCALQTRGLDFIDPVPLDPPDEAPPPPELSSKHFNDWTLLLGRRR